MYDDHFQGSLYEVWHVIVQARLRMDIHSLLGQQSPADLVVRGDHYSRKVRAFSSSLTEVSFEPANSFQLVPGVYNRWERQPGFHAEQILQQWKMLLALINHSYVWNAWKVIASPRTIRKMLAVSKRLAAYLRRGIPIFRSGMCGALMCWPSNIVLTTKGFSS